MSCHYPCSHHHLYLHSFPTRRSSDLPETVHRHGNLTNDQIFMQAASEGISMFAAAGNAGSGDGTGEDIVADYPSSSSYITDRKSTRLNSSHVAISYAVFCLKKKINND